MWMPAEKQANQNGFSLVIGIDEAGRGPLAGPVVASAVLLRKRKFSSRIRDSKKMTAAQREAAFHEIFQNGYVGTGIISEAVIDQVNILQATFLAMTNAAMDLVSRLPHDYTPAFLLKKIYLLVDGNRFQTELPYPFQAIVRGDESVLSIACASIVAKVTRDRILVMYDKIFPQYGFRGHKGYPTLRHRQAIQQHGYSSIHRRTFCVQNFQESS